jgi:ABC-type Zn2+ transport system substrate-binding protein/surface adhesin
MEIQTSFYLPKTLQEHKYKDIKKTEVTINFDDFRYRDDMIKLEYEYQLDINDIKYLLELIAKKYNAEISGDTLLNILLELANNDEEELFNTAIYNYIESFGHKHIDILNKLKEYVKEKAYNEFRDSFEYFVYPEDYKDYFEIEEYIE